MIRVILLFALLVGACFIGMLYSVCFAENNEVGDSVAGHRQLRINYVIENTSAEQREEVTVQLFHPFHTDLGQTQKYLNISPTTDYSYDAGDNYVSLVIRGLSPYERRAISLTYGVSKSTPQSIQATSVVSQMSEENSSVDVKISDIADKLSDNDIVKSVDAWLAGNISPAPFNAKYQSSLATLNKRQGDCTDFAVLAQDLLSARGVASVLVGGFVVKAPSVLTDARAYHNWLWLPDSGRIYDPINRKIAPDFSEYIALEVAPNGDHPRFYSKDSNIKVLMK